MKKTPIKYLIYREYIISKKILGAEIGLCVIVTIICCLLQMSLNFGNLGKLPADFQDVTKDMGLGIAIFPALTAIMCSECVAHNGIGDVTAKWNKFRLSLPVSPIQFALAKYLYQLCLVIGAVLYSAIYFFIISLMGNDSLTAENIKFGAIWFMVFLIFEILMQVLSMYTYSFDKAGMILFGVAVGFYVIVLLPKMISGDFNQSMTEMIAGVAGFFPWMVVITVAIFVTGLAATAMIYKRRER